MKDKQLDLDVVNREEAMSHNEASFVNNCAMKISAMKTEPSFRVKFSTRGRVTIPAPLRKKYGIKGGAEVAFEVTPTGCFILTPMGPKRRQ